MEENARRININGSPIGTIVGYPETCRRFETSSCFEWHSVAAEGQRERPH